MINELTYSFTAMLIIITLLPIIPSDHWFFRTWEFPRVQITILCIVGSGINLSFVGTFAGYIGTSALLVAIIYHSIWIFPYSKLKAKEVKSTSKQYYERQISLLSSNVLMPNHSAHKLIALVKKQQPDIIILLESNQWWQDALSPLHENYTYRVNCPLDNLYGMHLLSKLPLENMEIRYLIQDNVPSIHGHVILDGKKIKCHFLHPAPPSPTENETAKLRDKELLIVAQQIANNKREPVIVAGDLNDVAWSPTTRKFKQISRLTDPRIGRGMYNTFHAKYSLLRWPLDHIFHSQSFSLVEIKRLSSIDSDHFPLFTKLQLEE